MRKFIRIATLRASAALSTVAAIIKRATQPRAPITRAQLRLALALQALALLGALALLAFCPQRTFEAMGLVGTAWLIAMALFVDAREGRLGPPGNTDT